MKYVCSAATRQAQRTAKAPVPSKKPSELRVDGDWPRPDPKDLPQEARLCFRYPEQAQA